MFCYTVDMKKKISYLLSFLLIAMGVLFKMPALSHPHGWIEVQPNFVIENNKIVKIRSNWAMGEYSSMFILESVDKNSNGIIDEDEKAVFIEQMKDFVFKQMASRDYFSYIYINGKTLNYKGVKGLGAWVKEGTVYFSFDLNLIEPINISDTCVEVSFYDNSYYYDVYLNEDESVNITSAEDYSYSIVDDPDHIYYFNMVEPQKITIIKGKSE